MKRFSLGSIAIAAAAFPLAYVAHGSPIAGGSHSEEQSRQQGLAGDLRCFVATSELTQQSDQEIANAGTMASLYYLGRIDALIGPGELRQGINDAEAYLATVSKDELQIDCLNRMALRAADLAALAGGESQ